MGRRPARNRRESLRVSLEQSLAEAEHLPPAPPEVRWVSTKDTLKNQTERDYWEHLRARLVAGEIVDFRYEALTFRLGHDCRLTPDFLVLLPDGRAEFHEVKGFCEEDAKVKLRVFATLYPYWPIYVVTRERPLAGWDIKRVPTLTR
jgi:hypothetical protein